MIQPITNPIRFYKVSEVPDFNTYFPTIHNQAIGVEYYEAFKPLPYMREFDINENFRFQIQGGYDTIGIYKNNVHLANTTVNTTYGINKVFLYQLSEGIWQFKFNTDECMTDDTFEKPIEEIDFSKLTDEELWPYIFGEYIMNGRISKLNGFGSTQVETY